MESARAMSALRISGCTAISTDTSQQRAAAGGVTWAEVCLVNQVIIVTLNHYFPKTGIQSIVYIIRSTLLWKLSEKQWDYYNFTHTNSFSFISAMNFLFDWHNDLLGNRSHAHVFPGM